MLLTQKVTVLGYCPKCYSCLFLRKEAAMGKLPCGPELCVQHFSTALAQAWVPEKWHERNAYMS